MAGFFATHFKRDASPSIWRLGQRLVKNAFNRDQAHPQTILF
jgi:hypothetical protein